MFDKLVESTKQKPQRRNKFYLATSLIYGAALSVLAVVTIVWFNPAMAETIATGEILTPPLVPIAAPPPDVAHTIKAAPEPSFVAPKELPKEIADPKKVPPLPPKPNSQTIVGAPPIGNITGTGIPSAAGCLTCNDSVEAPPPPPTPAPTPKATPTPEPTPKTPDIVRLSSTMITGKAVHKAQPPYPYIAKQIKAQGTVPVQITISEEGRVLQATAVGGHPTLQEAARQAALQWVFSPTLLNGKAVKVAGVISFNFILN